MDRISEIVTIPVADVLESLGLDAKQLNKRLAEGIYPEPERKGNRRKFTLGWLTIAQARENEYKALLARVVLNKERRKRIDSDIKEVLSF